MRTYGLIGYPLEHSFSPAYFTKKFKRENIQAEYKLFPITNISELPKLIENHPSLKGLNVTIPYKEQVIDFLDDIRGDAKDINAVNTIVLKPGHYQIKLIGYNTDIIGFQKSLSKRLTRDKKNALILGTGATSKTIAKSLEKLNIEYIFVTRQIKEDKKYITYSQLTSKIIKKHDLIINTTPLGMYPDIGNYPQIPYTAITPKHLVFDVIYNPPLTRFLELCEENGAEIINGQEMLEYQAEESWRLWNTKTE
jgi:shikimate dehydrogenase